MVCKLLELTEIRSPLWIRRVLVRAQEGQLEGPTLLQWCRAFSLLRPLLPFLLAVLCRARGTPTH
jgi:hypothetical protein